jgi:hypothetical protein
LAVESAARLLTAQCLVCRFALLRKHPLLVVKGVQSVVSAVAVKPSVHHLLG